jgi:hypothetical protein
MTMLTFPTATPKAKKMPNQPLPQERVMVHEKKAGMGGRQSPDAVLDA